MDWNTASFTTYGSHLNEDSYDPPPYSLMSVKPIACIPASRIVPSGMCEMCHWDPQDQVFSSTIMMPKYRNKRNLVLDAIDAHASLLTVPHMSKLGSLHDVYFVCRHCSFLLRKKGEYHFRLHNHKP